MNHRKQNHAKTFPFSASPADSPNRACLGRILRALGFPVLSTPGLGSPRGRGTRGLNYISLEGHRGALGRAFIRASLCFSWLRHGLEYLVFSLGFPFLINSIYSLLILTQLITLNCY